MRVLKLYVLVLLLSTAQALSDCEALIANLAKTSPLSQTAFPALAQIEQELGQGSLIDIQKEASLETIKAHNQKTAKALAEPAQLVAPNGDNGLSFREADFFVRLIDKHPTHGRLKEKSFDPEGCFGFCFGRATLIHNEALLRNIPSHLIKKIWAVGPSENQRWQFHVSTLFKAESKNTWWAADPIFYQALDVRTWVLQMNSLSDDGRMMFFVTDPNRFSVYSSRPYSAVDLLGDGQSDFYNGYFKSYLESVLGQPVSETMQK